MIVYPTIELLGGKCVSLNRGRLDEPSIWHVDPVETARNFAAAGAEWMHLTDFDAVEGRKTNVDLVKQIIRAAGIPVQLGGGFRTAARVERWIDRGAGRIVISSLATRDPHTVKELAKRHPDQIVLSVDVWKGQVMVNGWRTPSAFTPSEFIKSFSDAPLAAFVVTDIESDVEFGNEDAQLGTLSKLSSHTRLPVIASGVVRTVDDISRLKYVKNISGALVGRALFHKTIDLKKAILTARPEAEPIAAFI
jgi:phosphoribosylformimino-5-aminoimidazole carboxamide ribotide isomerase